MARTRAQRRAAVTHTPEARRERGGSIPAAAVFSFLKETRGKTSWTTRDLLKSLRMAPAGARQALAALEMQGYIKPAGHHENAWVTTDAGESVSGSKFPRYSLASVEQSLASFAEHLKRVNDDRSAKYRIAEAVAFGDFLSRATRVQAADVGVRLVPRNAAEHEAESATSREKQQAFLKQLKGKTPLINVQSHADWMSARTHRKLI